MASKKKFGDCKKIFRFAPGMTAPIVNRDDLDDNNQDYMLHIKGWKSLSKMPSTELNMDFQLEPGKEYRVVMGYDFDEFLKYLLQEKVK